MKKPLLYYISAVVSVMGMLACAHYEIVIPGIILGLVAGYTITGLFHLALPDRKAAPAAIVMGKCEACGSRVTRLRSQCLEIPEGDRLPGGPTLYGMCPVCQHPRVFFK